MSRILPILFNQDMVRAILDGRKTVTRRIIKRRGYTEKINDARNDYACRVSNNLFQIGYRLPTRAYPQESVGVFPQYQVGDILYVRESYHPNYFDSDTGWGNNHAYKADYEAVRGEIPEPKWTPSIHMPKEAARIWLKVADVRVERLRDIDEDGVWNEGFRFTPPCLTRVSADGHTCDLDGPCTSSIKYCDMTMGELFGRELWDSTIKKSDLDRYGWNGNPWVWVYEFERCEKPEGVCL